MNFFERQDQSRRATRRLILLFALAVLAVVAAVDLVVSWMLWRMHPAGADYASLADWAAGHTGTVALVTLAVVAVIALASLYKTTVLGGGGAVVATALGGVRVSAETTDPQQRRLLNVVEEMAIASGVPVPEVYLLEQERGINAFAAGHNPANAAIGVTRGALTHLDRAELQGVIAHEFSHILNGDMRLNLRLMGLLFGLLVIALIGRTILRLAGSARSRDRRGGGVAIVLLLALAVIVIGYIGLFFGRLIQAAVSRSREALADASAVQFTRDPSGLRGALLKISAASSGSRLRSVAAEEVAHMLFAPGLRRWFATHPRLVDRLKALDPAFDVKELEAARARMIAAEIAADEAAEPRRSHASRKLDELIELGAAAPASLAALVGNPDTAHVRLAQGIRRGLPEEIAAAGRHPDSARALLLALALDAAAEPRSRQRSYIGQQLGAGVAAQVAALEQAVDALEAEQRMPALLRGFPALRHLAREERLQLLSCLNGMLQREGVISLRSYVLRKLAQVHLRDDLEPAARARQVRLSAVVDDVRVLLSALAQHGHEDDASARRAYDAGMQVLYAREWPAYGIGRRWGTQLDPALSRLDRLGPAAKAQLVEAMARTVVHDGQLTLGEAELLRAVCATLHCPLPPFVPSGQGQD